MSADEKKRKIPEIFRNKTYLDPTYDPAFKAFFAGEETLKSFLNDLLRLEGDERITSLTFKCEEENSFRVPEPTNTVFDIFATTGTGRFFDIEMQRAEHDFFIDRTLFYNAFLTIKAKRDMEKSPEFLGLDKREQAARRYELPEIVSIWICNFDLKETEGRCIDHWCLYSEEAVKGGKASPVSRKNRYIMVNLPRFSKTSEEIVRPEERWLYLLKNAGRDKQLPGFENEAIKSALERIRVDSADDGLLNSQEAKMVTQEEIDCRLASAELRAERAEARGEARGFARGEASGATNKAREMAKGFRDAGVPLNIIAQQSGLTEDEIRAL